MILSSFSRWQAAGLHLALSVLIAAALLVLVLALWYPAPYFAAMGGAVLLRLLIGVDVVLGPLITLIIFDTRKPRLMWDLAAIGVLQFGALLYGAWVMFDARPAYAVFTGDRFEVVAANSVDATSRGRAPPAFGSMPLGGPLVVGAHLPTDAREREALTAAALVGGPDIANLPHLYHTYAEVSADAARRAKPLSQLARLGAAEALLVRDYLAGAGRAEGSVGYLPVRARNEDFAMVVDRSTGDIVGSLRIKPW